MWDTPAKLISSTLVGLGQPEFLQEREVAEVVFRKVLYYYEGIRQSDQNLMASVTSEFTLGTGVNTKDLTALTSSAIVTPLWCERKVYDSTNDYWEFVPTVNLNTLEERRWRDLPAVAYYGGNPNHITAVFSIYGDEAATPQSTYRIWYSPTQSFTNNKDATLVFPSNLSPLVLIDCQLACIAPLITNASKYLGDRPELAARISAWESQREELRGEKAEWIPLWDSWRKRSRGAHRALNHTDVLGLD